MSKLDELIAELCPDGVEYKKVKDVYRRLKGTPITAGKMKEIENNDGEIRVFAGGKTVINAMEQDIPKANITNVPAVLVQSRGMIDVVYYDKPFTFKNEMWAYTTDNKIAVKFLYYVLKNNVLKFREEAAGMGAMPQISLPVTEGFEIPIPPLPVQSEIVRILDNFTELTAELTTELTTELTARKKQYEYYKNLILNSNGSFKKVKLGILCKIGDGLHSTPKYSDSGSYFFINGNNLNNGIITIDEKTKKVDESEYVKHKIAFTDNTILMSINGTIGKIAYYKNEPVILGKSAAYFNVNSEKLNSKYLYYYLQSSDAHNFFTNRLTGSTILNLGLKALREFEIPIPPFQEQERIVDILDRFDTLCNDISTGLPAEIEARTKQYEYYRDKLLTFKELS